MIGGVIAGPLLLVVIGLVLAFPWHALAIVGAAIGLPVLYWLVVAWYRIDTLFPSKRERELATDQQARDAFKPGP